MKADIHSLREKILILPDSAKYSYSLTFFGGTPFLSIKNKSLMVIFIEHALYGNMIYTIGLGDYSSTHTLC